jgi:hypothetical protein
MESSVLHSMTSLYEDQDSCLYFGLGLTIATSQILEAVERERASLGQPGASRQDENGRDWGGGESDRLLLFLLGLISFSKKHQNSLEEVRVEIQHRQRQSKSETEADLPRLALRDLLR